MIRNLSLTLCVLALSLVALLPDEAAARGGRRRGCGSSCGSSCAPCGPVCAPSCAPCGGSICAPCGGSICTGPSCGLVAPGGHAAVPGSAVIVVSLPADAKLIIDGQTTTQTTGTRTFRTPGLEEGYQYSYDLVAEVVREGRTERITQRVTFRAGQEARVTLDVPTGVASR